MITINVDATDELSDWIKNASPTEKSFDTKGMEDAAVIDYSELSREDEKAVLAELKALYGE